MVPIEKRQTGMLDEHQTEAGSRLVWRIDVTTQKLGVPASLNMAGTRMQTPDLSL